MSFDGVFTHAMINELRETLLSGRISKIHQPYENEVVLVIRSRGKNQRLLLSAHSSYARIQITQIDYQNPDTPPNFVMMLRKHLDGAILESIEQIENDRVIHFHFTKRDELGDLQNIILIVELMGRHSTIILVNKESGKILDAIKHIGSSQNTYRSLLPGVDYIAPPEQNQLNPFSQEKEKVFHRLSQMDLTPKGIQQQFQGIGFDTAQELVARLTERPNEKMLVWQEFFTAIDTQLSPSLYEVAEKEYFTPINYRFFDSNTQQKKMYPTLSALLDAFYQEKAEKDRAKQQGGELIRKIENELKRNKNKLKKREQTLKDSENAEDYRRDGELLTTFMAMFNQEKKADLVAVQPIYYFAGGFYSKNYKNADQLPKNAKVGIPSDPTNEGRALAILNKNGVIKLKDNMGFNVTVADIVDNPKNLQFERIDLLNLVKAYDEKDIAMVFCYPAYLEPAGLSTKDAILLEDEAASKHYALQLVTREGEKDSEKINVLKKAMTTKEVAEYIKKNSKGANIPAF